MTEAETWREAAKIARFSKLTGYTGGFSAELFGSMLADLFEERAQKAYADACLKRETSIGAAPDQADTGGLL